MKLSHSKLSLILSCPMSYYLTHEAKIWKKQEKTALWLGSAVHWGCEHNTEDLSEYFKQQGNFKQGDNYTNEQMLAEAMVHGYLKHKDEIFEKMLTDPETGEKLEMLEETHEIFLTGKLKSMLTDNVHEFVGIVDLLILTNKGFILADYKTSTYEPDWDGYLDQLYRYIFELRTNFPDVPIIKIGIINIRKTAIRQKKGETEFEFNQRRRFEYDLNDEKLINYHEFLPSDLNAKHIDDYIANLGMMADTAQTIRDKRLFFINYGAAKGQYGKSDFWDIFYRTKDAHVIYATNDRVWSDEEDKFVDCRDCTPVDMRVVDYAQFDPDSSDNKLLRQYSKFKQLLLSTDALSKDDFFDSIHQRYITDEELLELYWKTFVKEKQFTKAATEWNATLEWYEKMWNGAKEAGMQLTEYIAISKQFNELHKQADYAGMTLSDYISKRKGG